MGSGAATGSTGVGSGSRGVAGGLFLTSFCRRASRFFSSVLRNIFMVVRRALLGLQSSAETGVCSQTGQEDGRVDWPRFSVSGCKLVNVSYGNVQVSHMIWSQQGRRNALTARRLQMAHRSLMGISSWVRDLNRD